MILGQASIDKTTNVFVPVKDEARILAIGKSISPIYHVTADAPPTLIVHGERDVLVPIQQAEIMIARLKEAGVLCELVRKNEGHGWAGFGKESPILADWFDKYLLTK